MNDEIKGIIVQFREYREQDAMLHILQEDGNLVSVIAKGIQKVKSKNSPACQLFTYSTFLMNFRENSDLQLLRSAEILDSYRKVREDLYKQSIASYMCECLNASDFDINTFPLLKQSLDILVETTHPLRILCLFQSIMNQMHGIEPFVDGCVRCGSVQGVQAISLSSGGMICQRCYQGTLDKKRNVEELKRFRLLCKAQLQHYDIVKNDDSYTFSDFLSLFEYFQEYAGVNVRSIRFLKHLYTMEENSK